MSLRRRIAFLLAASIAPTAWSADLLVDHVNGYTLDASGTLQRFEAMPGGTYPIEVVVQITQTSRHLIAVYCRRGLISPVGPPARDGWLFDDEAIRNLRRLQRLRDVFELGLPALQLVVDLTREVERLRGEVRFLEGR